jgi:hypothetical protein
MRLTRYFIITSTAVLSLCAMAQHVRPNTNEAQLVSANAVLQSRIDAKTAKPGDVVTATLMSSVRLPGGTELKHNTLLTGHIDQVQAAADRGVSTVVLTFDKAQPKGGEPIAIKSTIVGIYPSGTDIYPVGLNPQLKVEQAMSGAHGYSLTSDVQGATSGVLKAEGKNLDLRTGTELQFAVAPVVAAASSATGN